MKRRSFTTIVSPDYVPLQAFLNADPKHPHIHRIDMPFRLTSIWQDQGCEIGIWQLEDQLLAWAVFQSPWLNFDYALPFSERGSSLEKEILVWGKEQIKKYSELNKKEFYGCVEFFENMPEAEKTIDLLEQLGFYKLDWSTPHFKFDLDQDLPQPKLPAGFTIRPFHGSSEIEAYIKLYYAVFSPGGMGMTPAWRMRTLKHPLYRPEIDFVVVSPDQELVGFCLCWMWQNFGQIEPLGVHPQYQRIGLGRALELTALRALRHQGAKFAYIDHASNNEKAIPLSLQTGFKQINNAQKFKL